MQQNYHLSEDQIAQCADAIVDGKYDALDLEMRHHLATCDECAAEVLGVSDIVIDFNSQPQGRTVRFKPWMAVLSGAAAVGLVLFALTIIFNGSPSLDDLPMANADGINTITPAADSALTPGAATSSSSRINNDVASPTDSALGVAESVQVVKRDVLADAYTPNQPLEALCSNFTQAYRGEDIVVVSKGITSASAADSLKWSNPFGEELFLEFFNNKGELIISLTQRSAGVPIPELPKGLYYWKLISKDFDLLFVGRILVDEEPVAD